MKICAVKDSTTVDATVENSGSPFYNIPFDQLLEDDFPNGSVSDEGEGFVFGDGNEDNLVTKLLRGEESFPDDGYAIFQLEPYVREALIAYKGDTGSEISNPLCFRANGRTVLEFGDFGGGTISIGG